MGNRDDETPKQAHRHSNGLGHQLADVARDAAGEAGELGERIVDAAGPIAERVVRTGVAAGRRIAAAAQMPGQGLERLRALRRENRLPLPNLYDVHPEARRAGRRQLGLLTIPVSRIRGTAVEGPAQRGRDFLPLPLLRSQNWQARWQRLRQAQDRLAILPPIDVLQTPEGYWVVDGHNRVGLALYNNQDDIDASVTHLHLPGASDQDVQAGSMATVLDEGRQLRAAGEGRLSRGGTARARARTPQPEPPQAESPPGAAEPRTATDEPQSPEVTPAEPPPTP